MGSPEIAFYFPIERDIEEMERLSIDRDWSFFNCGRRNWILQTMLEIGSLVPGLKVTAVAPARGVVILHSDDFYAFWNACPAPKDVFLVVVRADRSPNLYAHIEIVQNGFSLSDPRCRFISHWPQPGLVARDLSRGDRVEVVSYRGTEEMLHPGFLADEWSNALAQHGMTWECRAVDYKGTTTTLGTSSWPDYRQVDVVLAIRPDVNNVYPGKPATKLFNGWLAGTPCVLGKEFGYREIRETPEDFLEAEDTRHALELLVRLKSDSGLYGRMRQRASERATAFTREATRKKWIDLLTTEIPAAHDRWIHSLRKRLPLSLRKRVAMIRAPRSSLYTV